jgi:hypothetical protein
MFGINNRRDFLGRNALAPMALASLLTVEAVGCGRRGSTAVHHCGIAEDDSHLPGFDCPAAGKAGLLIVGGGEDQRCP